MGTGWRRLSALLGTLARMLHYPVADPAAVAVRAATPGDVAGITVAARDDLVELAAALGPAGPVVVIGLPAEVARRLADALVAAVEHVLR